MNGGSHLSAASASGTRTQAARLDWRFLLADPALDRVACVGRPDESLLVALRLFCRSVEVLEANGAGPRHHDDDFDVVIACDPTGAQLRQAARRVKLGGTLVVEVRGPLQVSSPAGKAGWRWPSLRPPETLVRRLSRRGFEDVGSYWHWPTLERCTRIIPLDDPTALRFALSRSSQGMSAKAGAWFARCLSGIGLLPWAVASVSVIGRRVRARPEDSRPGRDVPGPAGDATERSRSAVHAFMNEHWERLDLGRFSISRRLSFVMLTPRFRNSSHLVFLLLPEAGSKPILVAKVPRLPGRSVGMEREAERLKEIHALRPEGFDSVPRLVAFEPYEDRMIQLQTAFQGRAMDRTAVRKDAQRCCEAALAWLIEVQTAARPGAMPEPGAFDRLVDRELLGVEAIFPSERRLFERTRELLRSLASAHLPLVLEHRDLSHPNVMIGADGRMGVIDWEQADLKGLPATDLFFFLSYVATAVAKAGSRRETMAAFDRAFFGRRSWARTYIRRYAERLGLGQETLTPLFVAAWMRQVAGLAERVAPPGMGRTAVESETAVWLHRDWRLAAWRHAVENVDRLAWDDLP
ncbi:MAG TPA: aminoglycoside phosphotransferase family protein [Candidatus Limnocylindria bacterium]|nr:aminoglycoside phosphotransferase family protein [Candidatus Limnocylindria bacterium]